MSRTIRRLGWTMLGLVVLTPTVTVAQSSAVQAVDEEYTRLILEHTQDDRILTELGLSPQQIDALREAGVV